MQHFDGARLSPNSVRNAVWHALNEPVCQYLRTRNPRCSTVYLGNILGPLATESPCSNFATKENRMGGDGGGGRGLLQSIPTPRVKEEKVSTELETICK